MATSKFMKENLLQFIMSLRTEFSVKNTMVLMVNNSHKKVSALGSISTWCKFKKPTCTNSGQGEYCSPVFFLFFVFIFGGYQNNNRTTYPIKSYANFMKWYTLPVSNWAWWPFLPIPIKKLLWTIVCPCRQTRYRHTFNVCTLFSCSLYLLPEHTCYRS